MKQVPELSLADGYPSWLNLYLKGEVSTSVSGVRDML